MPQIYPSLREEAKRGLFLEREPRSLRKVERRPRKHHHTTKMLTSHQIRKSSHQEVCPMKPTPRCKSPVRESHSSTLLPRKETLQRSTHRNSSRCKEFSLASDSRTTPQERSSLTSRSPRTQYLSNNPSAARLSNGLSNRRT